MVCFFLQEWNCFTPVLLPSSWCRAEAFFSGLLTKVGNCCQKDLFFSIPYFLIIHHSTYCPRKNSCIIHTHPPPFSLISHVPTTAVPLFPPRDYCSYCCTITHKPPLASTHTHPCTSKDIFSGSIQTSTSINPHSRLYLFLPFCITLTLTCFSLLLQISYPTL